MTGVVRTKSCEKCLDEAFTQIAKSTVGVLVCSGEKAVSLTRIDMKDGLAGMSAASVNRACNFTAHSLVGSIAQGFAKGFGANEIMSYGAGLASAMSMGAIIAAQRSDVTGEDRSFALVQGAIIGGADFMITNVANKLIDYAVQSVKGVISYLF